MKLDRRSFIKVSSAASITSGLSASSLKDEKLHLLDSFERADSLYHGDAWESINPGYWQITDGKLRRRLKNSGDNHK